MLAGKEINTELIVKINNFASFLKKNCANVRKLQENGQKYDSITKTLQ